MEMRQVIENIRHAGLQVEADAVIAYVNRAQSNAQTIQAMWAEVEADMLDISDKFLVLSQHMAGKA